MDDATYLAEYADVLAEKRTWVEVEVDENGIYLNVGAVVLSSGTHYWVSWDMITGELVEF